MEAKLAVIPTGSVPTDTRRGVTPDAFDCLVIEHQRRIHRILLALLKDADAADTLTQECFLRAFDRSASFRGEASVGTWLVQIALNLARDHARSRRVAFWRRLIRVDESRESATLAAGIRDPSPSLERTILARERLAAVQASVERLPHRQRACFLLRFVERMTLEEIAQATHLKVGTVKSHLARAVGAVRRRLADGEGSCGDI
jgi:RNA polymerase sigma-70 factor (ECF subfamily)